LNPNCSCPSQSSKEETLSSEKHGLQIACLLDAKVDAFLKSHDAAGIDSENLILKLFPYHMPPCMQKDFAVSLQPLENKALPSKKSRSDPSIESHRDPSSKGSGEKRIFLAQNGSGELSQVQSDNLPWIGGRESDSSLDGTFVSEMGEKEGFSSEHTLACAKQLPKKALLCSTTITHFGFESDTIFHVVHGTGLSNHGLLRIKLDFYNLERVAEDFKIDFVTTFVHELNPLFRKFDSQNDT
jgi:hypothetical protein